MGQMHESAERIVLKVLICQTNKGATLNTDITSHFFYGLGNLTDFSSFLLTVSLFACLS
jgi:hypothetical protein